MRLPEVTEAVVVIPRRISYKTPRGSSRTPPSFTANRQTMRKQQLGKGEALKMTFLYRERTQVAREANHHVCEVTIGRPTL